MEQDISVIVSVLNSALTGGASWATIGILLTGIIRIYRLDTIQNVLAKVAPHFCWYHWPQWLKYLVPFALAAVASLFTVTLGGTGSLVTVVVTALITGLTSMATHAGTKEAGKAVDKVLLRKDPEYTPGPVRNAVGLALPVGKSVKLNQMLKEWTEKELNN
jgi:hypothetical protein